jgi:tetratricopeptide (TPR) repeat protein
MAIKFHPKTPILIVAALSVALWMVLEIRAHYPEIKASIDKNITPVIMKSAIYETLMVRQNLKSTRATDPALARQSKEKSAAALKSLDTDVKKAELLASEAIKLDQNNVQAMALLAAFKLQAGQKDEARNIAMDCVSVDPKSSDCYATLISSFTRFGEFDAAYPFLTDCLKADPSNIHCLSGLTTYYIHENKLKEAEETVVKMDQIDAKSLWTILARGEAFESKGDLNHANEAFQEACKLGQTFACEKLKR